MSQSGNTVNTMLPTQAHPIHQMAVVNCSLGSKTDWLKKLLVIRLGVMVTEPLDYRYTTQTPKSKSASFEADKRVLRIFRKSAKEKHICTSNWKS